MVDINSLTEAMDAMEKKCKKAMEAMEAMEKKHNDAMEAAEANTKAAEELGFVKGKRFAQQWLGLLDALVLIYERKTAKSCSSSHMYSLPAY